MLMTTIDEEVTNNAAELLENAVSLERNYSTDLQSSSSNFILSDIYHDSAPQLLKLSDGKLMLIWAGDDGTKTEYNRSSIFYSIYNGTSWSKTMSISNNNCYNSSPVFAEYNNRVYVLWQRTATSIPAEAQLTDVISDIDLYYSVYENGAFSAETKVFENSNIAELSHSLIPSSNGLEVIWMENSENNIYATSGTNTLKKVTIFEDASVSEPQIIAQSLLPFGDYVGFDDGTFNVAYTISSSNLDKLYLFNNNNSQLIYHNDSGILSLHYNGKNLIFSEGTKISSLNTNTKEVSVLSEGYYVDTKFYSFANKNIFVNTQKNEENYYVNISEYDKETNTILNTNDIYRSSEYIVDYDIVLDDNSEYVVALNSCDFDLDSETMFSNFTLSVNRGQSYNEIRVNEFAWCYDDIASIQTRDIATIHFEIENTGNTDINSLYYTLTDESSNEIIDSGVINDADLSSGEIKKYSIPYSKSENFNGGSLRIDVSLDNSETSTDDNFASLSLGLSDLSISDVTSSYSDNQTYINCKIKNSGYQTAQDLHFYVYNKGKTGELIYESTLDDMAYNEEKEISFVLPDNYCASIYDENLSSIELSVQTSSLEKTNDNNDFVFVYDNLLPFEFEINNLEDGITITKYTGDSTNISIPETIDGVKVTKIANTVFRSSTAIRSITIPSGVTAIDDYTFSGCAMLKTVNLPDSLTSIGKSAFNGCTCLTNINLSDNIKSIGRRAFYKCTYLKDITINASITSLGAEAFEFTGVTVISTGICGDNLNWLLDHNTGLLTVTGEGDMYNYNSDAYASSSPFDGVGLIKKIVLPDKITSIGDYAFYNCSNLTEIEIPDSVKTIGVYAFRNCRSLKSITLPNGLNTINNYCFSACVELTDVIMPDSITTINECAFLNCTSLKNVTFSDNISVIDSYAFINCSSLESEINLNNIEKIGTQAFESCQALHTINIFGDSIIIKNRAFSKCSSLKNINISANTINIEPQAFEYCSSLEYINIPDGMSSISRSVFLNCTSLKSVIIPNSITSINAYAFYNCKALKSITIPNSVTSIGSYTFAACSNLSSIYIPNSVTSIDYAAFSGCSSLESVYYSGKYSQWNDIKIVAMNDELIAADIIFNISIVSLNISNMPDKTNYMVGDALDTTGLSLTINYEDGSSELITDGFEISGFDSETAGTKVITITYGNCTTTFDIIVKDYDISWSYNSGSGALTISGSGPMPDYTKRNTPWFHLQNNIYSIVIEDGVTSIGDWAFAYLYHARSVNIPDSVTSIGDFAFYYDSNLEEALIPESVTALGSAIFCYCTELRASSVPENLTYLPKYTFFDCDKLNTVYYNGDSAKWNAIDIKEHNDSLSNAEIKLSTKAGTTWSFDEASGTLTIGGYGRMENYNAKSAPWYQYANGIKKIVVSEGVTGLGNWAFSYLVYAAEIELPESLVHIGSGAFYRCSSLKTIDIPQNITRIFSGAFYNCTSLESLTIPKGVTTVYANTFQGCSSLADVSYNGTEVQWAKMQILANNTELTSLDINYLVKSIEWSLSEDGTLTISGGVPMDDYELKVAPMAPWASVKTQIKKVVIEDGITNIGKNAFYGCTNLTEVVIPDSVTSIGYGAFWNCLALESIEIPEGVTYLGAAAFYNCASLKEITLPASVTSILVHTFYNCKKLATVNYSGDESKLTVAATNNEYFTAANIAHTVRGDGWRYNTEINELTVLESKALTDYTSAEPAPWKSFRSEIKSVVIKDGVTKIGALSFFNCTSLTKITIPASVTEVGKSAFYYDSALQNVYYGGTAEAWNSISIQSGNNTLINAAKTYA